MVERSYSSPDFISASEAKLPPSCHQKRKFSASHAASDGTFLGDLPIREVSLQVRRVRQEVEWLQLALT